MSTSGMIIEAAMPKKIHLARRLLALLAPDEWRFGEHHFLLMPRTIRSAVRLTTKVMMNSSTPVRNSTW